MVDVVMTEQPYDIAIVGGGLAGLSLAWALRDLPLRITLLDAGKQQVPCGDSRALALNHASYKILEALDVWSDIAVYATPIEHIHISQRGCFGAIRLDAAKEHVAALAYVLPLGQLHRALYHRCHAMENIDWRYASKVNDFVSGDEASQLCLHGQDAPVNARLTVAADGSQSVLRRLLGIATQRHDYQRSALVTQVDLSRDHLNTAYERFTQDGSIALMPLAKARQSGVIWVVPKARANVLLDLPEASFLACLQQSFGYRLGEFQAISSRKAFPLAWVQAQTAGCKQVVLLGNAGHTLHPVAAQGFNLSLRDVAALTHVITQALQQGQSLQASVATYVHDRLSDWQATARLTHRLVQSFTWQFPGVSHLRSMAMLAFDHCTLAQRKCNRRMMGVAGRVLPLICGVPEEYIE